MEMRVDVVRTLAALRDGPRVREDERFALNNAITVIEALRAKKPHPWSGRATTPRADSLRGREG